MIRYLAITTCNLAQWEQYGRAMANTYARHWPVGVPLIVYAEGFDARYESPVGFIDLDIAAPWLSPWKVERTKQQRGQKPPSRKAYDYKWDAVRFSHKIAALGATVDDVDDDIDVVIWMDADIVTHSQVTVDWLDGLFPPEADFAWLDRAKKYPECGFMMFRRPRGFHLIDQLVEAYQTGAIFGMLQTHDSFVIQEIVNAEVARGELTVASLSGEARAGGHPFCAGILGSKMDHLKGTHRKVRGKSYQADLQGSRSEPYWQ